MTFIAFFTHLLSLPVCTVKSLTHEVHIISTRVSNAVGSYSTTIINLRAM